VNDALLKLLSRHMRLLSEYYAGATLDDTAFRLAQRLIEIAGSLGVVKDDGIFLSSMLSQSELASMVGASRQTVNRVLQDFQEKGWISTRGRAILVTNLAELQIAAQKGARLRGI
jgi:CRP-like cAMP-binding protein